MQIKKNPNQQVEKFSKIFFELGLVLALFVIYSLIEYKSYDIKDVESLGVLFMNDEMKEEIPIVQIKIETPPPKAAPAIVEQIKVVKDDLKIEESIIESTEIDEGVAVIIETREIIEVKESEEIEEDVAFVLIEDVPIYPGCKGNNKELKKCFTEKLTEYFGKNFDTNLAQELGLAPGKKRFFVVFRIDKYGKVTNVQVRAPHPILEKEVKQIISSLPKMTPGKQRGTPVGVSYSIPITFLVKE